MKFSRNPESGILECYTDDGVFIGNVYTSEPESGLTTDSMEEITEDGGAGSGNFGHKGRPGQVGGSSSEGGGGGFEGSGQKASKQVRFGSAEEYSNARAKYDKQYKTAISEMNKDIVPRLKDVADKYDPEQKELEKRIANPISDADRDEAVYRLEIVNGVRLKKESEIEYEEQERIYQYLKDNPSVFDPEYEFKKLEQPHDPKFGEEQKIVNPDGLYYNCQRCVVAEEMRFRGYDVKVTPGELDKLAYAPALKSCFPDAEIKSFDSSNSKEYNESTQAQMLEWGDGARAICSYVGADNAHVFTLVNEGGIIKHIDSQNGSIYTDQDYIRDIGMPYLGIPFKAMNVELIRTDNATPSIRVKEYCESR